MLLQNNYSHKFINTKKIIAITNNTHRRDMCKNFLSIPYKSSAYNINTNVLVGFNNEEYSKKYLEHINTEMKYDARLYDIELDEFKYIGSLMNIPIVVVLNDVYDVNNNYEIFYHYKHKNDLIMRSFNDKNL